MLLMALGDGRPEQAQPGGYQLSNDSGSALYYWPVHTPTGNALSSLWAAQSPGLGGLAQDSSGGDGSYRWAVRSSAKKSLAPGASCRLGGSGGLIAAQSPAGQPPGRDRRASGAGALQAASRQGSNLIKLQLDGQVRACFLNYNGAHTMGDEHRECCGQRLVSGALPSALVVVVVALVTIQDWVLRLQAVTAAI